jgi:YVTN family beta-propeller protein
VSGTLNLLNGRVFPGDHAWGVCYQPSAMLDDPLTNSIFVACDGELLALNATTGIPTNEVLIGDGPAGMALDPSNGYLYVTNAYSDNVSVINGTTGESVTSIPVGGSPEGIAYDTQDGYIYVANYYGNVSVIDGANNTVVGSIVVGFGPQGVAFDGENGLVYVSVFGSNDVIAINGSTGYLVDAIPAGADPGPLCLDTGNDRLYIADETDYQLSDNVSVIDTATNTAIGSISVGFSPVSFSLDEASGDIYVSDGASESVSVISGSSDVVVGTIPTHVWPGAMMVLPTQGDLYVANQIGTNLTLIDLATSNVVRSIPLDAGLGEMVYDSWNGDLYAQSVYGMLVIDPLTDAVLRTIPFYTYGDLVADSWNGNLFVTTPGFDGYTNLTEINGTTGAISDSFIVGGVWGMAFDDLNGRLYICSPSNIVVVDGATDSAVANFSAGPGADGIAFDSYNGYIYVPHEGVAYNGSQPIFAMNATTGAVVANISAGPAPSPLVVDDQNGDVYVGSWASDNVTVVSGRTNTVLARIPVGSGTDGIAYDGGTGYVYVESWSSSSNVTVIDSSTNTVLGVIDLGLSVTDMVLDNATGTLYIADAGSSVLIINGPPSPLGPETQNNPPQGGMWAWIVSAIPPPCDTDQLFVAGYASGGSSPYQYTWDFGDGTANSTGQYVYHTVTNPPYVAHIVLTATDSVGMTADANVTLKIPVTVACPPCTCGPPPPPPPPSELAMVVVVPSATTLNPGENATFLAVPSCAELACPSGGSFNWTLNSSTGKGTTFTGGAFDVFSPGNETGNWTLSVAVNLTNRTVESLPVHIFVRPDLQSVSVTPNASTVAPDGSQLFRAMPACFNADPCLSGITYAWSLSSDLGTLNSNANGTVTFVAGSATGSVILLVRATQGGRTVVDTATITIAAPPPANSNSPGMTGDVEFYVVGTIVVALLASATFALYMRGKRRPDDTEETALVEPAVEVPPMVDVVVEAPPRAPEGLVPPKPPAG